MAPSGRDPFHLPDASLLRTEAYLRTGVAVHDAVEENWAVVITGPGGTGKTRATTDALQAAAGDRWVHWEAQPKMTPKQTVARLHKALTGTDVSRQERFTIFDALEHELQVRPTSIFIDEAHQLGPLSLEVVRHLFQSPRCEFPIIMAGAETLLDDLAKSGMATSRIAQAVNFRPLTRAEVLTLIPDWHPLYRSASPDVIELVDARCHGVLRNWANFTRQAVKYTRKRGRTQLDMTVVRAILSQREPLRQAAEKTSGREVTTPKPNPTTKALRGARTR